MFERLEAYEDKYAAAARASAWDAMYDTLVEFHRKHGHCRIPHHNQILRKLYNWVSYQRINNALSEEQRQKLANIKLSKESHGEKMDQVWNQMFEKLKLYKEQHGVCLVPWSTGGSKLYDWVAWQRRMKAVGKLLKTRKDRLDSIGFCWDTSEASDDASQSQRRDPEPAKAIVLAPAAAAGGQTSWDVMYEKLVRYYKTYGYCSVSRSTSVHLNNWILEQRAANANNEQSAGKRLKLDQIHFAWMGKDEKHEEIWNTMFESIKAYKAANGDCLVPEAYQEEPKLYNWVKWQRRMNKKGKLPLHRRDRLEGIGFCRGVNPKPKETKQAPSLDGPEAQPNVSAGAPTSVSLPSSNSQHILHDARSLMLQKQWDEIFERFKAFVAVNGDHVALYVGDPQLCNWVEKQRYNYKQGKLLQYRREKLESIGFTWDAKKAKISLPKEPRVTAVSALKNHSPTVVGQRWNLQLERLKIYQAWHDNCSVPTSYDKELAEWVSFQHYLNTISTNSVSPAMGS